MEDRVGINLNGKTVHISSQENLALWEAIANQGWEKETLDLIKQEVSDASSFMDIGAWAGPISLYAAHYASTVYAIEPDPVVYTQLKKNVALNTSIEHKINCYQLAIDCEDSTKKLYARKDYGKSSTSLLARVLDETSSLECDTLTFKSFLKKNNIDRVGFIKIDIEGSEFLALPKMKEELINLGKPSLLISFHLSYLIELELNKRRLPLILSKLILKLHHWIQFIPFKKELKEYCAAVIEIIELYGYCYSLDGEQLNHKKLLSNPLQLGNNTFYLKNNPWRKHA